MEKEKLKTIDIKGKRTLSLCKYHDKKGRKGTICNGYKMFGIYGNRYYEHIIVWEKFNGKVPKGFQIHHIDGNKLNNDINNLECISMKEHLKKHAIKNCLGKDRIGISPTNKTKTEIIYKIKEKRKDGYLLKELCKIFNLSYPTIQKYSKEKFYE